MVAFWRTLGALLAAAAAAVVVIGVIVKPYYDGLDGRIRALEDQVHTLTTALSTAEDKTAEKCAKYADQLASGWMSSRGNEERIRSAVAALNCSGLKK